MLIRYSFILILLGCFSISAQELPEVYSTPPTSPAPRALHAEIPSSQLRSLDTIIENFKKHVTQQEQFRDALNKAGNATSPIVTSSNPPSLGLFLNYIPQHKVEFGAALAACATITWLVGRTWYYCIQDTDERDERTAHQKVKIAALKTLRESAEATGSFFHAVADAVFSLDEACARPNSIFDKME